MLVIRKEQDRDKKGGTGTKKDRNSPWNFINITLIFDNKNRYISPTNG